MPRVIHFEIQADDPDRAVAFYQQALGWSFQQWGGPAEYWLATTGDASAPGINGAIMRRHNAQPICNTVDLILAKLAYNPELSELFLDYPRLTVEDIQAVLEYARVLVEEAAKKPLLAASPAQ